MKMNQYKRRRRREKRTKKLKIIIGHSECFLSRFSFPSEEIAVLNNQNDCHICLYWSLTKQEEEEEEEEKTPH